MDHDIGTRDLTGRTQTERVAYEGMIDGCHVFVTADWRLSSLTGVQMWNLAVRLFPRTARQHHQHPQI